MAVLIAAVIVLAMLLGAYLVYLGVRHKRGSARLGLTHAALAITTTGLLLLEIYSGESDKMNNFAALFLFMALVGGGMVFALREPGKPPSMIAVSAHAIMGVIAASILVAKAI